MIVNHDWDSEFDKTAVAAINHRFASVHRGTATSVVAFITVVRQCRVETRTHAEV